MPELPMTDAATGFTDFADFADGAEVDQAAELPSPGPEWPRVLLIDDDPGIPATLSISLRAAGYAIQWADTGALGLTLFQSWHPDLVVLDLGLPDLSGFEVCRALRAASSASPSASSSASSPCAIIILTVRRRAEDDNEKRAFAAGATDYLQKPITPDQLLRSMRRALNQRQTAVEDANTAALFAQVGLIYDRQQQILVIEGKPVHFTSKEFELLKCLARHAGQMVSNEDILCDVWGASYVNQVAALRVYVHNIRRKLEQDPLRPRYLLSAGDFGYQLCGPS